RCGPRLRELTWGGVAFLITFHLPPHGERLQYAETCNSSVYLSLRSCLALRRSRPHTSPEIRLGHARHSARKSVRPLSALAGLARIVTSTPRPLRSGCNPGDPGGILWATARSNPEERPNRSASICLPRVCGLSALPDRQDAVCGSGGVVSLDIGYPHSGHGAFVASSDRLAIVG